MLAPGAKVVDLGCGDMSVTYDYIKRARSDVQLIGIEKFADGTIYGKQAIAKSILGTDGVSMLACDIEEEPLPFADAALDAIYCSHVLEHLSKPAFLLDEAVRVVKPGGLVYVEVPGPRALLMKKGSWFKRWTNTPLSMWDDPTHVRPPFSVNELRSLFESRGMAVVRSGYCRELGVAGLPVYAAMFALGLLPVPPRIRNVLVGAGWWNLVGWPAFVLAQKR